MATETNQETIVCRSCGQSIHSVSELRAHEKAHGLAAVNSVLSAQTKHGTTLGQHHAEVSAKRGLKDFIDRHYHEIMLAEMTIELALILLLVILAWRGS